jgi:hypothetical protein
MFIVGNFSFWESRITTLPNDTSRDRNGKRKFPMNETDSMPKMLALAKSQDMIVRYTDIDLKRWPQAFMELPQEVWNQCRM